MVRGRRVRVGIALHAVVNLGFAGVAVATDVPVPTAGSPGVAAGPAPIVLVAAVESAPAAVHLTTTTTRPRRDASGGTRTVTSTGYCLEGTTASGAPVGPGQAAMNGVPLGSRVELLDGPLAGTEVVVTDRIGHGTDLDVWFDDCADAVAYGRRTIVIRGL